MSNPWTYDRAAGQYVCGFPGCKYRHANLGAIQLHMRRKDHQAWITGQAEGANAGNPAAGTAAGDAKPAQGACPDCGQAKWRLLRSDRPEEAAWIAKGMREVCKQCKELR